VRYGVDFGGHMSLGGKREAFYEQRIIIFSMEKKIKVVH
jgi:hypothetical protein